MPRPDIEWWQINLVSVAAVVVGAALALFVGLAVRRWLELLEEDRAADAHLQATASARERGLPPPARPAPRQIPWVRLLPWLAGFVGVATVLDALDLVPVHVALGPLVWGMRLHMTTVGDTEITTGDVVKLLLVISIGRWVSVWAQRALGRRMRADPRAREGAVTAVQRLLHAGLMTAFVVSALVMLGLNLSALLAASAVFAVGLGFGLQALTANFVSGLILLIERTVKPGDVLLLEGRLVRVTELGLRATIGRTLDDDDIIIPNAKLLDSFVVTYSLLSEVVRARATVGVSYLSDVDEVIRVLTACATASPLRVASRPPMVLLKGFGESSIDFEVSVWLEDVFLRDVALSALRVEIWRALRAAHIDIAFPQLDVHIVAPAAQSAQGLQDAAAQGAGPIDALR